MANYTTNRHRRSAVRNPSMLAHELRWSMSTGRAVRVTDTTGKVRAKRVLSLLRDPQREAVVNRAAGRGETRHMSTLVATFEGGEELAVDGVARVQLPLDGTTAAFGE